MTEPSVSRPPPCRHTPQNRNCAINIVDDKNVGFAHALAVQAADILRQCALPRDWHCQNQRVESGIVESFTDMPARCQDEALFGVGNGKCAFTLLSFCG